MIICSLCTSRHPTSSCSLGLRHIEDCLSGTVDDYVQPMAQVIPLPLFRGEERRAIEHWGVRIATNEGLRVDKLA